MPVVSSAIAAITAALTVTTVATVASAVAATGTLIGMAGLGVTAVGMVTKNKGILKAGKIMGLVGLGMGVTGWAVGALNSAGAFGGAVADSADDLAAGSLDDMVGASDDAFGQVGQVGDDVAGAAQPAAWKPGTMMNADQALPGSQAPSLTNPNAPLSPPRAGSFQSGPGTDAVWAEKAPSLVRVEHPSLTGMQAGAPTPPAPAGPVPQAAPGGPTLQPLPQGPVGTINTPPPTTEVAGGMPPETDWTQGLGGVRVTPPPAGSGASGIAGWWNSLKPDTQAFLALAGGHTVGGMVSNYMAGLAADEELEFRKQVEAWRQRNGGYAPRVSFSRPGVLGRA